MGRKSIPEQSLDPGTGPIEGFFLHHRDLALPVKKTKNSQKYFNRQLKLYHTLSCKMIAALLGE
jgi:hypothetical protein